MGFKQGELTIQRFESDNNQVSKPEYNLMKKQDFVTKIAVS